MRILVICPIPVEFTSCRTGLSLRDTSEILGCRTCHGSIANVEIIALQSGPAKARAASATVAGIDALRPDLVIDSGTCAALDGELVVNSIVIGLTCLEYDISGTGLPVKMVPEMRLPSGFQLLARKETQRLVRAAAELGSGLGLQVRAGAQACGEFFIQSVQVRETLHAVSGAVACNWETAGVFIGALRARVPPLSLRVVSDLGDEDSLRDFRKNARRSSHELYRFLRSGI
ncbi:MAG TPA: 5'-methylthioadenosine/S-adenosylhomocysteine nucleosidase, partial [Spirochaetia bacterium]|nr:5'-methylthioadenosine/S-adenosylhomocysteine nucleosidase [Spirochaetia bacterium]